MSYFFLLPRRRHFCVFGGHLIANALGVSKNPEFLRGGLSLSPVSNRVPGPTRMGFSACVVDTFKQTFRTIFRAAKVLGSAVCRCLGHCCICSDCLPSSEAVGLCVGRFLTFVVLAVCCPCFCCWCICKAIILFRRRKRDQDPEDRTTSGYNTIDDNDSDQQGCFGRTDDSAKQLKNYLFYTNEIVSEPRGARIEDILTDWYGKYDLLENHHGFIQWLFPLYERGVNSYADPLTLEERQVMLNDAAIREKMKRSCRLMLDFYGIDIDESTGELSRKANYKERFRHLNIHSHNYLRITRIIKCLVIFDHRDLAKSIIKFFVTEICKEGNLQNCRNSCKSFWIPSLHPDDIIEMQMYSNKLEWEAEAELRKNHEADLLTDDDDDDEQMMQVDP